MKPLTAIKTALPNLTPSVFKAIPSNPTITDLEKINIQFKADPSSNRFVKALRNKYEYVMYRDTLKQPVQALHKATSSGDIKTIMESCIHHKFLFSDIEQASTLAQQNKHLDIQPFFEKQLREGRIDRIARELGYALSAPLRWLLYLQLGSIAGITGITAYKNWEEKREREQFYLKRKAYRFS